MTRPVHLGSWALFCDLSGRVRGPVDNPIVTTAAVAVPVDLVRPVRTQVRRLFPGERTKWKYGKLPGFEKVVRVLEGRGLAVAVNQLHIGDLKKWTRYFEQGKEFVAEAGTHLKEVPPYLEPSMTLRMRLLGGGFAQLVGRLMRLRYREEVSAFSIELEIVVDTDFRDEETEEQFITSVVEWAPTSRLVTELGVRPLVRQVRCKTEQAEPLLLLPDYIAGVYHHADPRTVLGQSVVTPSDASRAVHDLRRRLGAGRVLFENAEDFNEEYPLDHDEKGRVIRRPTAPP